MTDATLLFANLGAEEEATRLRMSAHPRVRSVARLWAALRTGINDLARAYGVTPLGV